ncbi:universal stress protein [Aureitalea sp. L0-47]|uniref:universal stress protein n=1 Tax=Aureitalea sp. L0-47 TaxID=2816962 RepID=UPI002237E87A|nr:universal stress protein [Aureitalea sp. L0-47]MCW5519816.1 universal stress protein [Aureitalea sp. L0-47]
MKKILVPTDFSENAYNALIYASRLFEKKPCIIYILHSIEVEASRLTSLVDISQSKEILDALYDESDSKCEEVKARLIEDTRGCGHKFDVISTAMSLPRAMNRICIQRKVDFVVMGTKGRTGAKEVILGSNTIKVIDRIKKTPVLVVPPNAVFQFIELMAFPTSFEKEYHPSDLDALLYLAKLHNSEIKVLHVREHEIITDTQRKNLDALMNLLSDIQCNIEWLESNFGITTTLSYFVDNHNVDLLAIIYYKHNFIVQLFRESIVKKIGRRPSTPYLVIPAS